MQMPKNVKYILSSLEKNGFAAFVVGGCVRDWLLNIKVSDYDITTNARPSEIKKIFKRTIDTGIKHGTVTVLLKNENNDFETYEVTTFRIDGNYTDSRHPDNVTFVSDIKYDLARRDFTINALAYSDKTGIVDEFGGIEDLKKNIVKCVLEPKERFKEDALRMLRAVRFASKLNFHIEDETLNAIKILNKNLINVSKERINVEFTKILTGKNPSMSKYIFDTGLDKYIAKDFEKIIYKEPIKTDCIHIALSSFFYENINFSKQILTQLKYDNNTIKKTMLILENKNEFLSYLKNKNQTVLKNIINNIGFDLIFDLITVCEYQEKLDLNCVRYIIKNYISENMPIFIKDLDINGNDLIKAGLNGKIIGEVLTYLLKIVYIDKNKNNKRQLLDIAKEYTKKH